MRHRAIAVFALASMLATLPVGVRFTNSDGSLEPSVAVQEACGAEANCHSYPYMFCWFADTPTPYPQLAWDAYHEPCGWC